jgi:SAM-dependent methyltransferase
MFFNTDIRGKLAFALVAKEYDAARPSYPEIIFRDAVATMRKNGLSGRKLRHVLEVGAGSGQATEQLLTHALHLDVLEPGPAFARLLRRRYRDAADTHIHQTTFEAFRTAQRYDLVAAASALHWIPRELFYGRIFSLLKPGGWFLGVWHQPTFTNAVYEIIEDVIVPHVPEFWIPRPTREVRNLFATGYADFSRNRGFLNCRRKTYSRRRRLSAELCAALIWSYVDVKSLRASRIAGMQKQLERRLAAATPADFVVRDTFQVVMGQSPKTNRPTKRSSGLAIKSGGVDNPLVASR